MFENWRNAQRREIFPPFGRFDIFQTGPKKVSGKTYTQAQLDDWANQHNSNDKAYKARIDNRAEQLKSKKKTHSQIHAQRRHKAQIWPDWAPDYPDYDD